MRWIHDLGGEPGFGAVSIERDEPTFHHAWERRAYALNLLGISTLHAWNVHEYRHAVERIERERYLSSPYYERWFTGVASLLVEKGVLARAELEGRVSGEFPLARPAAPGAPRPTGDARQPRFATGAAVRVREQEPLGHTRAPRYVRGKRGVVVRVSLPFELPDLAAHALPAPAEPTYHVELTARELWGPAASAGDAVVVDLWESYLEAAQ